MNLQGFQGIFRAGGIIPAGFGEGGGDDPLIDLYGNHQQCDQYPTDPLYKEESIYLIRKILPPAHTIC
jgi:hypothetical protein